MGILNDLLARVVGLKDGMDDIVRTSIEPREADILELQKEQLFEGKASSGEDLRPYYSEDLKPAGYFRDIEAAKRYAAWKENDIAYPYEANRNPDTPNLYINGKFHGELGVNFGPMAVGVVGTTPYAAGIMAKYGISSFGLTISNWNVIFADRGAYDALMEQVRNKLYGSN